MTLDAKSSQGLHLPVESSSVSSLDKLKSFFEAGRVLLRGLSVHLLFNLLEEIQIVVKRLGNDCIGIVVAARRT